MTQSGWTALQNRLLSRYAHFKKLLTQRLGSADRADDALQETWLRLERGGELTTVRSPDTFLYTMAINIAWDRMRADNRRLTTSEIETLLSIPDDAPSPARIAEARIELEAVKTIIAELPARQQAILLAARVDGLPRDEIARRFGVSVRFVQRELQEAHDYCASRLEKLERSKFRSSLRKTSTVQRHLNVVAEKPKRPET
ncbi:MAG: RNA polymerase sigma factor [Pseudomonadota bacterium]